jgi:hypothetical protein
MRSVVSDEPATAAIVQPTPRTHGQHQQERYTFDSGDDAEQESV